MVPEENVKLSLAKTSAKTKCNFQKSPKIDWWLRLFSLIEDTFSVKRTKRKHSSFIGSWGKICQTPTCKKRPSKPSTTFQNRHKFSDDARKSAIFPVIEPAFSYLMNSKETIWFHWFLWKNMSNRPWQKLSPKPSKTLKNCQQFPDSSAYAKIFVHEVLKNLWGFKKCRKRAMLPAKNKYTYSSIFQTSQDWFFENSTTIKLVKYLRCSYQPQSKKCSTFPCSRKMSKNALFSRKKL